MAGHTIEHFMSKDIICVEPSCPIDDVLQDISACRISCVVVCEQNRPVGIITERDVVQLAANRALGAGESRQTAGEVMTSPVTTVRSCDPLDAAIALTQEGKLRHLPVVDSIGGLVGLLTQTDLLTALVKMKSSESRA